MSLVLDLQQEVLSPNCDVLNALRKAHLIAVKLGLDEFDVWIQSELNGYTTNQDAIPDYRKINGQLKAWNPLRGWIPVILQDSRFEDLLCTRKMEESVGDILELYRKSEGHIVMTFTADIANQLNSMCNTPFQTNYSLHVSSHQLKSIVEKIINFLLEWTLKLEQKGIVGENMRFNEQETRAAQSVPQQINNYYGTVVNGDIKKSQIVSGDNNILNFNYDTVSKVLEEIDNSLAAETLSSENMDIAKELIDEAKQKNAEKKNPSIIKVALNGLKDFLISVGANVTANLIVAKMQGLF